jgi:DUF1365 family protein
MMYLDLDELSTIFAGRWFWSIEHANIATFFRRDHVGASDIPLKETIRNLVESETSSRPTGAIRLLTHLSYFGYCFNPLSIYFCFEFSGPNDTGEERLHSVVAEVTNTPWGERHCYVLRVDSEDRKDRAEMSAGRPFLIDEGEMTSSLTRLSDVMEAKSQKREFTFTKAFHVSPFMGMDFEYRWQLTGPSENLVLHTENWRNGRQYFDATLVMRRRRISTWSLARMLIRYPLMTIQVTANIHWQAFWLWWKKVPYVPHPKTCHTADRVKNNEPMMNARDNIDETIP